MFNMDSYLLHTPYKCSTRNAVKEKIDMINSTFHKQF